MNSITRPIACIVFCLSASFVFAQPTTAPTTAPAKPSAEQQALMDAYNASPTDAPLEKKSMNPFNRDGSVNANFNQPDKRFLQLHQEFLERSKQPAQLLFIGDSITEGWRGNGKQIFQDRYAKYQAANFGISGDRTEHVLWRIQDGELDALKSQPPKVVVIMIGTNNSGHSADEIAAGTTAVVKSVQAKLPDSKILLLSIFPRGATAADPIRTKLTAVNQALAKLDDGKSVKYFELWQQFLTADGTLPKDVMPDLLHPNAKGYQIWADAMQPVLEEMMK